MSTIKHGDLATDVSKRVVVIASGETERRALPLLTRYLAERGVVVEDVRIPPRHHAINVDIAEKIIRSVWFERAADARPGKFVVLLDTDQASPCDVIRPLQDLLPDRLQGINASIQFAFAQQHLEAWYFADADGLRRYLGRDLGDIDPSQPDAIVNPKLHLKHLLGRRPYSSLVSQAIAAKLDAATIAHRSPSFQGFVAAIENGGVQTSG